MELRQIWSGRVSRCDGGPGGPSFRRVGFARAAAGAASGAPRPWQCACKASRSWALPRPILIAPGPRRGSALLAPYTPVAASDVYVPPEIAGPVVWPRPTGLLAPGLVVAKAHRPLPRCLTGPFVQAGRAGLQPPT